MLATIDLQFLSVHCGQGGVWHLCFPNVCTELSKYTGLETLSTTFQFWRTEWEKRRALGEGEGGSGWGLEVVAGYSPGPFGSGQGGVPFCGSAEPVPVSLARLLWLPDRWLGGWDSSTFGDSTLPPARDRV